MYAAKGTQAYAQIGVESAVMSASQPAAAGHHAI